MSITKCIEEFLKNYHKEKEYWNPVDGCVLMGVKQMYDATGEEKYLDFIESYLKPVIMEDGVIADYQADAPNLKNIQCSQILFFMYDKTGDEKYRKAIEFTMDKLREHPRDKNDILIHCTEEPERFCLKDFYMVQPFYMAYETRYEKKEKYNDIINHFDNAQKYIREHRADIRPDALDWYLMAMIDTMDNMSFEIYEQYRKLQDDFKLTLKDVLQNQDKSVMTGYCMIKACRMGILLKEKYTDAIMEIMDNLKEVPEDAEAMGVVMMAYGQYLLYKKELEN